LGAFEQETLPAIKYFAEKWQVVSINADQTIDEIFEELIQKLGLK
jgi:adenylate kinase family enzyme